MEYRSKSPVMKRARTARRQRQRQASNRRQEAGRRKAVGGGKLNELGVTQGQNGEQGNSPLPQNNAPIGQPGSQ